MAEILTQTIEDKAEWEAFIATHPETNFLQAWNWGEFHNNLGHKIYRVGFYKSSKLVGVMLAIVEPAKRGRHLVVPAGPILDWQDKSLVQAWLSEVRRLAKAEKCVFVRVRPQLTDDDINKTLFYKLGFNKAPMHLHAELTSQLDLTKTDEELRSAMRKGTKYELNRVQKLGIKVEAITDDSAMDEFYDLQLQTAQRQKFVPFSKRFLSEQFKAFASDAQVIMYRASYQNKLLSMAFIIFYGNEADYHYGASTDLARQFPGAYAIQSEAIAEARRRGCTRYNFWGVTEHGQTKHRFYGVSVFKRGFGGEDVAYLPAQDLPISLAKYKLTYLFETARRKHRNL